MKASVANAMNIINIWAANSKLRVQSPRGGFDLRASSRTRTSGAVHHFDQTILRRP